MTKKITLQHAMPIQNNDGIKNQLRSIPLDVFQSGMINYEKRCRTNNAGQSLEAIRLRGGFSPVEAFAVLIDMDWNDVKYMEHRTCDAVLKRMVKNVETLIVQKTGFDALLNRVNELEQRAAHAGNTLHPIRNAPIGPDLMVFSSETDNYRQRVRRTEDGWLYQQPRGEWVEGLPSWECGGVYYMLYPQLVKSDDK